MDRNRLKALPFRIALTLVLSALALLSPPTDAPAQDSPKPPRARNRGDAPFRNDENGLTIAYKLIDLDKELRETSFQGALPENRFERPEPTARSFDWTTLRPRMAVHDQGKHGTCWAHAAVSAMEWSWMLRNGRPVTLSPQPIIDRMQRADGGLPMMMYEDLLLHGTCELSDYPYTGQPGRLKKAVEMKFRCIGFGSLTTGEPAKIKKLLVEHGPLASCIEATPAFQKAKGGVFSEPEAKGQYNHFVLIVGWDDGKRAWKIQNSWGNRWGEGGFQWVAFGTNSIGSIVSWVMAQAVHYELPSDAHTLVKILDKQKLQAGQGVRPDQVEKVSPDPFPVWPKAKKIGSTKVLTPAELHKQETGQRYRVEFVVKNVILRKERPLSLTSGGRRDDDRVIVKMPSRGLKALKDRGIDDPEKYFPGKRIRATGQIHSDGEDGDVVMQINPADLEVVDR